MGQHSWIFTLQQAAVDIFAVGELQKGAVVLATSYTDDVIEKARLACLRSLEILDTESDERIDRVTRIAAEHFQVPIALVSLLDEDRQWFKSRVGIETRETPRCHAFCDHAIRRNGTMVVPNATQDDRFKDNPLVTGEPHIRFYAGAPITIDAQNIGTLCIIDSKPRNFFETDVKKLESLAHAVHALISSRANARNALARVEVNSSNAKADSGQ
ncbi:MAG: GAF domain-containing protein [Pseudomonadota bacterium]